LGYSICGEVLGKKTAEGEFAGTKWPGGTLIATSMMSLQHLISKELEDSKIKKSWKKLLTIKEHDD